MLSQRKLWSQVIYLMLWLVLLMLLVVMKYLMLSETYLRLLVNRFILITIGCQFRTPMGWGCCCWPDDSKNLSMERLWRVVLLSFISTWRWTNKTCSSWTSSNTGGACFSMSSWRDWNRDNLIWWRRCTCDNGRPTSWPLRCTDDDAQMLPDVLVFL